MACCSSCAVSSLSRAAQGGDPIALKLSGMQKGQTMGLIGVWPSDVVDLKRRIDPSMQATDRGVRTCASIATGEKAAWADFFKAWTAFRDSDVPWFGSAAKYDEADAYRVQLGGWQEQLAGKCGIAGPKVSTEPDGAAGASALKWVAAAIIAGAIAYTVAPLIPRRKT